MVSNGPFMVRSYVAGSKLILERNSNYYRTGGALDESVTPYRFEIMLNSTPEQILEAFNNNQIVFAGSLPLASRKELLDAGKLTVNDTMSVMSCIFNTTNELLADADVRKALSLALDRNKIAEIITFGKPIEGLIADGVFNTTNGKGKASFRDKGEALISASADLSAAQSLLAGKTTGAINLVVRDNEQDKAVGEYIKSVWDSLGFEVKIKAQGVSEYKDANELTLVKDKFNQAYTKSNFDVILVDYLMFSTDAFGNLASFAKTFAGGAMDMDVEDGNYQLTPHISGYDNPEYDAIIEQAYAETDADTRAELLHKAEKMLLEDMPITPLVQLQNAAAINSDLTKVKTDYYGSFIFTKVVIKNRYNYESTEEEKEITTEPETAE
jgi:oligopeptide transport system substrate-binding protein